MKILYGIQLTGNGHITRSIQIIKSLKESGCEVDIITSGNNSQLELPYEVKKHYRGLSFFYNKSGGIDWIKTIKSLDLSQFLKDIEYDVSEYDIVVSDFEPISAWSAKKYKIPSIGIGNQYSFLSKNIPRPKSPNKISEMFLKKFAKCDYNIAMNYQKYDDFISLPIINEDLLGKETKDGDFYLVYLPSLSTEYVLEQLKDFNRYDWKIYSPDVKEDYINERVQLKLLNKEEFTKDLLNCKGVITASGFSTTTEALVLNKKIWSIPIKGQYEQLCNAIALKSMGVFTDDLNSETISKWITSYHKIDYDWDNPIDEIVQKIINYNGKN
jgi:uncharacterized protein (TIGR00661 family)